MLSLRMIKNACAVIFILISSNVHSLDVGVSLAYSKGGDTLVNVSNDNDFLVGDGITMGLVARQKLVGPFELRSSVAFKYKPETYIEQGSTPEGDVVFTSVPVTLGLKYNLSKKVAFEIGGVKFVNGLITDERTSQTFDISSNMGIYSELIISTKRNKHFEFAFRYISGLNYVIDYQNVLYNYKGDHFVFIARNYF